jgi:hypothetical protein
MRKQFHTLRKFGHCMQRVVAMSYESASSEVAAVPGYGGLDDVTAGVYSSLRGCGATDLARPGAYGGE